MRTKFYMLLLLSLTLQECKWLKKKDKAENLLHYSTIQSYLGKHEIEPVLYFNRRFTDTTFYVSNHKVQLEDNGRADFLNLDGDTLFFLKEGNDYNYPIVNTISSVVYYKYKKHEVLLLDMYFHSSIISICPTYYYVLYYDLVQKRFEFPIQISKMQLYDFFNDGSICFLSEQSIRNYSKYNLVTINTSGNIFCKLNANDDSVAIIMGRDYVNEQIEIWKLDDDNWFEKIE